jgi:hypothetical protein
LLLPPKFSCADTSKVMAASGSTSLASGRPAARTLASMAAMAGAARRRALRVLGAALHMLKLVTMSAAASTTSAVNGTFIAARITDSRAPEATSAAFPTSLAVCTPCLLGDAPPDAITLHMSASWCSTASSLGPGIRTRVCVRACVCMCVCGGGLSSHTKRTTW